MIKVLIAGDGSERDVLENLAKTHKCSNNIKFLGSCSQNEVHGLLARTKIFCLPSLGDSVGVATMEAMAMGVAVVSTTVKGIPELVHNGETGILVPPGNAEALASALLHLLEDEDLRKKLGAAAKLSVLQDFNQVIEVTKLRNLIHTI